MSGTTSVPAPAFGPNGLIIPAESAILTGALADINAAFETALNPSLTTPQGQIASSEAAIIGNGNNQFLALLNGVDPAYSSGRMQDAIGRIYLLTRQPATSTMVNVLCMGLVNVNIGAGALLQAQDGNLYSCVTGGTIPSGGTITLAFACVATGPIACPAQMFVIYQAISGWDSAVSSVAGILGNSVESRAAFAARMSASVLGNAMGFAASIRAAVLSIPGVVDCFSYDNSTSTPVVVGGVTIPARSVYVSASGGTTAAIAAAIFSKKPPGCGTYGGTTITVYDNSSPYPPPGIPYSISFDVMAALPFAIGITIVNSSAVPATAVAQIQAAIIAAFAGSDGGSRASAGSTVYVGRYYAAIAALGPWVHIVSIQIGLATSPITYTGSISGNVLTVSAGSGVAVGQVITGTDSSADTIAAGTMIKALVTGTGGPGTYLVSMTQTILAGTIITAYAPSLTAVSVNVNQEPAIAAAQIGVILQ